MEVRGEDRRVSCSPGLSATVGGGPTTPSAGRPGGCGRRPSRTQRNPPTSRRASRRTRRGPVTTTGGPDVPRGLRVFPSYPTLPSRNTQGPEDTPGLTDEDPTVVGRPRQTGRGPRGRSVLGKTSDDPHTCTLTRTPRDRRQYPSGIGRRRTVCLLFCPVLRGPEVAQGPGTRKDRWRCDGDSPVTFRPLSWVVPPCLPWVVPYRSSCSQRSSVLSSHIGYQGTPPLAHRSPEITSVPLPVVSPLRPYRGLRFLIRSRDTDSPLWRDRGSDT